jgi:hypothetical protein
MTLLIIITRRDYQCTPSGIIRRAYLSELEDFPTSLPNSLDSDIDNEKNLDEITFPLFQPTWTYDDDDDDLMGKTVFPLESLSSSVCLLFSRHLFCNELSFSKNNSTLQCNAIYCIYSYKRPPIRYLH